ncbi:hypothetical protein PTI98_008483 [Pleurotus ostreatus]|nr:hypothetical protein PTI98_008483 [Pleurotus ostreatus]
MSLSPHFRNTSRTTRTQFLSSLVVRICRSSIHRPSSVCQGPPTFLAVYNFLYLYTSAQVFISGRHRFLLKMLFLIHHNTYHRSPSQTLEAPETKFQSQHPPTFGISFYHHHHRTQVVVPPRVLYYLGYTFYPQLFTLSTRISPFYDAHNHLQLI